MNCSVPLRRLSPLQQGKMTLGHSKWDPEVAIQTKLHFFVLLKLASSFCNSKIRFGCSQTSNQTGCSLDAETSLAPTYPTLTFFNMSASVDCYRASMDHKNFICFLKAMTIKLSNCKKLLYALEVPFLGFARSHFTGFFFLRILGNFLHFENGTSSA